MCYVVHHLEKIDPILLDTIITILKLEKEDSVVLYAYQNSPILDKLSHLVFTIRQYSINTLRNNPNATPREIIKTTIKDKNQTIEDYLKKTHDLLYKLDHSYFGISYDEFIFTVVHLKNGSEFLDSLGSQINRIINHDIYIYQEQKSFVIQKLINCHIRIIVRRWSPNIDESLFLCSDL